jgi:GTPase SAR1 family protein
MVQEQQRQETKTIKLGIWGTRSAGKTVYMLMLYHYLQRSKRKDRFLVKVGNEQTDKFLEKHLNSMIYKGEFPTPTVIPKEDKYNSYSYKLKRVNSDTIVELTFLDLPGELWEDRSREKKVKTNNTIGNKNYGVSVAKYLTQCHGILILLSPLKEDYNDSYLPLLDGLFRLMLREIPEFKLEQYVVFGITKADHDKIYQRTIDTNFYQLIMEIIGLQVPLEWLKSYFYLEIVEEKDGTQRVNVNGENNRCCFLPISPFAKYYDKDGKMISPVITNENKTEEELKLNESQQEPPKAADKRQGKRLLTDPFKKDLSKKQNNNDDYEGSQREGQSSYNDDYETPSTTNYYEPNQEEGKYKIDTRVTWRPQNVVEPIEWLIQRIENHPPKIFD